MGTVPENGMAFMPSGQNTVDMIPELPDIDFFGVPGNNNMLS